MCNLIIDEGNSLCKLALMDKGTIVSQMSASNLTSELALKCIANCHVDRIISSTTRSDEVKLPSCLNDIPHLMLDCNTPLPIHINYGTPQTLGRDRIAGAVGANVVCPHSNVLIIDIGTAITIDFLDEKGVFQGGTISLAPEMRAKALHQFTGKLPLVDVPLKSQIQGKTTHESIQFGIYQGINFEIDGYIRSYIERYDDVKVVVTGGNSDIFINNAVIREPNLVIIGLNAILESTSICHVQKNGIH